MTLLGVPEGHRRSEGGVTRDYIEANVTFFVVAAIVIMFLHNWFLLLAVGGAPSPIWAAVDIVFPLVIGVLGCRVWRGAT